MAICMNKVLFTLDFQDRGPRGYQERWLGKLEIMMAMMRMRNTGGSEGIKIEK